MPGDHPGDGDDADGSRDAGEDGGQGSLLGALRAVVEALGDPGGGGRPSSGDGRVADGHFTTEYGISGRLGRPRPGHEDRGRSGEESTPGVPDRYRIDTRYDEAADEVLVVADLPDVTVADLTVGLDRQRNELVVAVEDRGVERLALPWPVADVESRFNHGVLELRVRPGEAEG